MKKVIPAIITSLFLLAVTWIPCQGEETTIYACTKKNNGQMRVVSDPCECKPSENVISWTSGDLGDVANILVHVSPTGEDLPGRGLDPANPFKTINYAIQRVPSLRSTPDVYAILIISPGTYNESVLIMLDKIWLIGPTGQDAPEIRGPNPNEASIIISNSSNANLQNIKVSNGLNCFLVANGSSVYLQDTLVQNATSSGIVIAEKSTVHLFNCSITECGGSGLVVAGTSNISLSGNINSSSNADAGIIISSSSNALTSSNTAQITSTDNGSDGIGVAHSSSFFINSGSSCISMNNRDGVIIGYESSFTVNENSNLTCSQNRRYGTYLISSTLANFGSMSMLDNADNGIKLLDNGYIFMPTGLTVPSSLTVNGNTTGILATNSSVGLYSGGATINGNGNDVSLFFGSRAAFLNGNTIGNISCDGTALITGEEVCP